MYTKNATPLMHTSTFVCVCVCIGGGGGGGLFSHSMCEPISSKESEKKKHQHYIEVLVTFNQFIFEFEYIHYCRPGRQSKITNRIANSVNPEPSHLDLHRFQRYLFGLQGWKGEHSPYKQFTTALRPQEIADRILVILAYMLKQSSLIRDIAIPLVIY